MSVTVLVKNSCHTVGEGPHWVEATQTLLYVDLYRGHIHKYDYKTGKDTIIELEPLQRSPATGHSVGFVVPRKSGGYVVGIGRNLSFLNFDGNEYGLTTIQSVEPRTSNRFNDAKCDPSGRLWAGTMGAETGGFVTPGLGSLYSLDKDKSWKSKQSEMTISNGLAWSSNQKKMYYIDSAPCQVYSFDFDIATGTINNKKVIADWSKQPEMGFPDGMCIDAEDKLWVACYGGSKVVRLNPETGAILQTIKIPARRVTSCCFGGPNYDELFVTCAKTNATDEELAEYPLTGSVFKVTGLGVKGTPGVEYIG